MRAQPGDHIILAPPSTDGPLHDGEVLEARGPDGSPPYLVRWSDGHEALIYPGPGSVLRVVSGTPHHAAPGTGPAPAADATAQGTGASVRSRDWQVRISLLGSDDDTEATVVLLADSPTHLTARGHSHRGGHDSAVPEIGDEVAVARALRRLADTLLETAATDIEAVTGEHDVTLRPAEQLPNAGQPADKVVSTMRSTTGPAIVVGVDACPASAAALQFAGREARARGWPVHVVHAVSGVAEQSAGRQVVTSALASLMTQDPSVSATGAVVPHAVVDALVEAAGTQGLVVVGARGRGAVGGRLLGSTSLALVRGSNRPVVVVRTPVPPGAGPGRVVVGVDQDTTGDVVGFAFSAASARGCELVAVHAWADHGHSLESFQRSGAQLRQEWMADEEAVLREALEPWVSTYPSVRVHRHVTDKPATEVLLDQADGPDLLVLGRGGLRRRLPGPGSTADAVLHHATCAVAIVPPA